MSTSSSVSVSLQRGERRDVVLDTGRRLGVHDRDAAGRRVLARARRAAVADRSRGPTALDTHDLRAATARDFAHAFAEHAVDPDDHGVARLDEVDEARLHARGTGAAHRQGERVRRCGTRSRSRSAISSSTTRKSGSRWPSTGRWNASITSGYGFDGPGPSSRRSSGCMIGDARATAIESGETVEDVGLGDQHLVERPLAHDRTITITPADDHVDPARLEAGIVAPPLDRLGGQRAEDLLGGRRACRRKWWIRSLSLASMPSSIAPIVHDGARGPDRASWRDPRRARCDRRRRDGRAPPTRPRSTPPATAGRECRNCSVRRTHPMSTETRPSGVSVPTMNSVEPPPTSTTRYGVGFGEAGRRARGTRAAASSSPLRQLGAHAEQLPRRRVEELVAVRGIA